MLMHSNGATFICVVCISIMSFQLLFFYAFSMIIRTCWKQFVIQYLCSIYTIFNYIGHVNKTVIKWTYITQIGRSNSNKLMRKSAQSNRFLVNMPNAQINEWTCCSAFPSQSLSAYLFIFNFICMECIFRSHLIKLATDIK